MSLTRSPILVPAPATRQSRGATVLVVGLWLAAVGMGGQLLWRHALTPGTGATRAGDWPTTQLSRATDRPTLVMVLHPFCPCSRASVDELDRILRETHRHLAAFVLFVPIDNESSTLKAGALWKRASAVSGVTVLLDTNARLAREFGANTSGQTFVYGPDGKLRFDGGITNARGHVGESAGDEIVEAITWNQRPAASRTPVYGCSLW